MTIAVPRGFRFAGVYSGVKSDATKLDLSLISSDVPAVGAGVYTQNRVFAAPVALDRARTPAANFRAVVINSGNANACTGERGLRDAEAMAQAAAAVCGAKENQALVMSTGIIGVFLDLDRIRKGIQTAAARLSHSEDALLLAVRGMLTTDTTHKVASRSLTTGGREIRIAGMAKGAAMIGPNLATMLGLILTDAHLDPASAQKLLAEVVEDSFNCISVDGHMSTNDTVLLLANGANDGPVLAGPEKADFREALAKVCAELAQAIPADGEGATHLITLDVIGCASPADARRIARAVVDSPLVKAAIAGADPNWGRIVSAAGYAGVRFDPGKVRLTLNDTLLYEGGAPVAFDAERVSESIRKNRDTHIGLYFAEGSARTRYWTTDLTAEYVRLNSDYHT